MPAILTSENYKEHINEKTNAIIDFSAVWCGPCKKMEPMFKNAETFIKGTGIKLEFFKVDVDDSEDIATNYKIESMPTLILIKNGKIVERSSGYMDSEKILIMIGRHFDIPKEKMQEASNVAQKHNVQHSSNSA
ncbi:thioredoxin [Yasminevirus sp. GU-2018]|uniref:Thioredoxin n=1 Tax=Yasminevirus sp. GU-2018 TaxID=2420051 RepID=A0A5K0U920_9VIRU|nr:thioredoxin [Yasminevirus sp. GU-2018]